MSQPEDFGPFARGTGPGDPRGESGITQDAVESILAQVKGVATVRVRMEGPELQQVHAVAVPGRRRKGLIRAMQTALFARLGLDLPAGQFRVVVSAAPRPMHATGSHPAPRLQFRSVNVYRENQRAEVQVELLQGARTLIGTAAGAAIRRSLPRLVAQATLKAIGGLTPLGAAWELLAVERRRIGGRPALLCHLVLLRGRRETHLVGSVFQAGDPLESTVLAVLDATNRVLPRIEGDDEIEYEVDAPPTPWPT